MDLNFEAAELKVSDFSQEDVFNSIDLGERKRETEETVPINSFLS